MLLNLLFRTLRRQWRVILLWIGFCLLLGGYNLVLYPYYFTNLSDYGAYLANLTVWMKFVAGPPGQMDTASAFLTLSTFSFTAPLVWLALMIKVSVDETAYEEESGKLTFLLIHPVQRWKLFLTKALAILIMVVLMGLILLNCITGVAALDKIPVGFDWLTGATLDVGLFVLFCSALTLLLGAFSGRVDVTLGVVGSLIVAMWVVEGLTRLAVFQPIAHWVNPFGMMSMSIAEKNTTTPWVLAVMVGLVVLCLTGGAFAWQRRSIFGPLEPDSKIEAAQNL